MSKYNQFTSPFDIRGTRYTQRDQEIDVSELFADPEAKEATQ